MARRGNFMSDELKLKLADDLGFRDVVETEGWANIRAKDAGNLVKQAIKLAEQQLASQGTRLH